MRAVLTTVLVSCLGGGLSPVLAQEHPAPTPTRESSTPFASRVVTYHARDVLSLRAQLRFTTMIVLPADDPILDVTCGDKELWLVNANENFAYVKPAKASSQTNLNLLTASGQVYSFVLTEVSTVAGAKPDVKVYIELAEDEPGARTRSARPLFVSAQQVEDYRVQVELAREELGVARAEAKANDDAAKQAKADAQTALDQALSAYRATYPTRLRFTYVFPRVRTPFAVTAIFHDETCTYIQASPSELPTLYEVKDGAPNLVTFEYRNGTYVIPKVLDQGYLAIGKARFYFTRQR